MLALAHYLIGRHNRFYLFERSIMEFLSQYGLFLLKTLTIVIALLVIFAGFFSMSRKPRPKLEVTSLNEHYEHLHSLMNKEILGKKSPKKKKNKDSKKKRTKKKKILQQQF